MTEARLSDPIRSVASFEGADDATPAPRFRALDQRAGELFEVVQLQRESPEGIAGERIETRGDENEIRDEALRCCIDAPLERGDVALALETSAHRNVPDSPVRAAVIRGSGPRIPRPLMHRYEVNVRLVLHESLSPVSVVHVPVHYQYSLKRVLPSRVVRAYRDVAKEAEAHRAIVNGVMAGRTHRAEASPVHSGDGEIDRREDAPGARGGGVPRPIAGDGIRVEAASATRGGVSYRENVFGVVRQTELFDGGVTSLEMVDRVEEVGIVTKRPGDRAQPADVLRMSPPGIVPAAIAVRYERGPHGPWQR